MGVTVGTLAVELETKNKRLNAGLKQSGRAIDGFARKADRAVTRVKTGFSGLRTGIGSVRTALAGLAGALAIGFFVRATKNALEFGDAIAKTADRIGISVEALQELRFVATQSGVDISTLESSLGAFTKRVGEARAGGGALTTQLKKTNPELLNLLRNANSTEQAFATFLSAIEKAPTELDKAALASAGFSRAGLALVNLANQGAEAIEGLAQQARDAGIVFDEDLIRKTEALNDEMDLLALRLDGSVKRSLIAISPIVKFVGEQFATFAENLAFAFSKFQQFADRDTLQLLAEQTELARKAFELQRLIDAGGVERGAKGRLVKSEAGILRLREQLLEVQREQVAVEEALAGKAAARAKNEEDAAKRGAAAGVAGVDAAAEKLALEARQATALQTLIAEEDKHRLAIAAKINPILAEIETNAQLIIKLQSLDVAEGAKERRTEALNRLLKEQADLRTQLLNQSLRAATSTRDITGEDFERGGAALLGGGAFALAPLGGDPGANIEREEAALKLLAESDALKQFGDETADLFTSGLLRGMEDAFSGEGIDFLTVFAETGAELFSTSMEKALEGLNTKISETFAGLGEGLGSALGIGLGIGAQLLSGALAGTDKKISRSSVASAVTSTQELRGVVAGPANIAIAQVAPAIADAFVESETIAKRGNFLLAEILAAVNRTGGGGGGAASFDVVASQSLG